MKNLNHILMLALFIVSFLLFRQCGSTDDALKRAESAEEIVQTDTVTYVLPGTTDTIHDTITKWYPKMVPYYAGDTTTADGDSVSLYVTTVEDSLISGKFTSSVQGKVLFSDFKYKAKFPKYILKTDTIVNDITAKSVIVKDPLELYVGGVVGGSTTRFELQPAVLLRIPKKKLVIGYGYDVIQKTHNVHMYTRLR